MHGGVTGKACEGLPMSIALIIGEPLTRTATLSILPTVFGPSVS
jgi:hypothetical protein